LRGLSPAKNESDVTEITASSFIVMAGHGDGFTAGDLGRGVAFVAEEFSRGSSRMTRIVADDADQEMRGAVQNSAQPSIFDAIAAREAAEAGMEIAAKNNRPLLIIARQLAVEIGRRKGRVTADDVQAALIDRGYPESSLGNAAGSVFRGGQWRWNGETVKSERVASHGRLIRVWTFVG
jgi:hypothetical protein